MAAELAGVQEAGVWVSASSPGGRSTVSRIVSLTAHGQGKPRWEMEGLVGPPRSSLGS